MPREQFHRSDETIIPFKSSPNCSGRTQRVTNIVLHSTCSGLDPEKSFNSAVNWLCNPEASASAHFVVPRDGLGIVQLVDVNKQAWHAGKSTWEGREGVNGFSVGIEIDHQDNEDEWPILQVQAVAILCRELCEYFGLDPLGGCIISHAEIAVPHGRKVDPVDFPWWQLTQFLGG